MTHTWTTILRKRWWTHKLWAIVSCENIWYLNCCFKNRMLLLEVVSCSSPASIKPEQLLESTMWSLKFKVKRWDWTLLHGRPWIASDGIGCLLLLYSSTAETSHSSTASWMSLPIGRQDTTSLALWIHFLIPWSLEWALAVSSGLIAREWWCTDSFFLHLSFIQYYIHKGIHSNYLQYTFINIL